MKNSYVFVLFFCLMFSGVYAQENIIVTGTVLDAKTGIPVPSANIIEKGTSNGTMTDFDGNYSIEVPKNATLEISFLGYATKEVKVDGRNEIDIDLEEDASALEEVVVVGYGTQKKISVVGAISTIEPEKLRTASTNISTSLAGNLSGIIAVQRTGQPGADAANFFIRGISTFSGAQNPLILLDGVEISSGDLNALSPEIIESVSVLKDATATAVYGTRGANGVLIITTKTGKNFDKPRIYTRIQSQVTFPTETPEFADGVDYMRLYNEAVTNRSTGEILYTQDKIQGTAEGRDKYLYPNVDWYDEMFKDAAYNQEANVNIQGGGEKVGYFMSATLNRQTGLLKNFDMNSYDNNIEVQKFTFQNNIDAELSPTTKVALKLNTQLRYYDGPSTSVQGIYNGAMNTNPVDFPMYFPLDSITDPRDIQYGGKTGGAVNAGWPNPFAELTRGYTSNFQSTVLATLNGEQKLNFLLDGLTLKGLVSFKNWANTNVVRSRGYNQYEIGNPQLLPNGSYNLEMVGQPQNLSLGTGTGTSGDRRFYFQPSLEYSQTFGKHSVSGLLLYNQTEFAINNPDGLISSLPERRIGYAGRATYDFDNKYLFEANFGYNGSENFAEGKRFGFFPSAAVGYVISNEDYFRDLTDVINLLKLRVSYGKVGNDRIGGARFPYLSDIDLGGRGFTTGVEQNTSYSGPVYNKFANRNITWETANKLDIGLQVGLLNSFSFEIDLYHEKRENIFVDISSTIPTIFGTAGTNVYANLGEVTNQGLDFSLDYNKQFNEDFRISAKGTFTYAHNNVELNNEPPFSEFPNLSAVGHPIGTLLGYEAERLFIDQAEVDASPVQQLGGFVSGGDIKYTDITGNGIINSDDRTRMGYPTTPEIVYGLSTSLYYKNWDMSFLLQGVERTSFFVSGFHPFGSQGLRNVLQWVADDHYSPTNPDIYAAYPKLSKLDNGNNTANSSYWLRDGSFLKLRSAEIGYSYKQARFFVSGYNLLRFSKFDKWDPEQGGGSGLSYPTQTIANLGVQLRFN
ncbi:TonB-dependent receptor [Salegentibacter sp. BLCTC]|uniref:SusC/RagA family TonB-linked outer membrane protein n=1 Tax=Salegentibacter sp. BLCTC TaxID=2697368 RepID=UPI001D12C7C1|nr:TonB-dependent receptor [Salegentibacter sp. BLCTC]